MADAGMHGPRDLAGGNAPRQSLFEGPDREHAPVGFPASIRLQRHGQPPVTIEFRASLYSGFDRDIVHLLYD
jgi:hypothetical protein